MKLIVILVGALAVISLIGFILVRNSRQVSTSTTATGTTSNTTTGSDMPSEATIGMNQTAAREIVIEASEFKFSPSDVRVKKGETVKLTLKNVGKMPHDWVVEKMGGASIDKINGGQTTSITITPSQTGTFTTFCSVGNHRQQGMVGKLIVE